MATRLSLQELTRDEARAAAPATLLVFPVGATEQHGLHLPVGTDAWAVGQVAREAAATCAVAGALAEFYTATGGRQGGDA